MSEPRLSSAHLEILDILDLLGLLDLLSMLEILGFISAHKPGRRPLKLGVLSRVQAFLDVLGYIQGFSAFRVFRVFAFRAFSC